MQTAQNPYRTRPDSARHRAYIITADTSFYASTPLHVASGRGHCELVAALVKSNADIEATNRFGDTPLCYAIKFNSAAVRILIESHANVNHKARNGRTPLLIASQCGNLPALKALLAAGANRTNIERVYSAEIAQILADAARPWSPDRHFLRGFPARAVIKTLLLVGLRRYSPAWHIVMVHIN
jgi:hypothetical protein